MIDYYVFTDILSDLLKEGDVIVTGNGTAFTATHQSIRLKPNQRFISNIGCASMGYGFPAAIGAAFAAPNQRIILLDGDGSFQMNLQELQTVVYHKLPLKMFILNNHGYLAIRITQERYFKRFGGIDPSNGVSFPSLNKLAKAYGIPYVLVAQEKTAKNMLKKVLRKKGPVLCEIDMPQDQKLVKYT